MTLPRGVLTPDPGKFPVNERLFGMCQQISISAVWRCQAGSAATRVRYIAVKSKCAGACPATPNAGWVLAQVHGRWCWSFDVARLSRDPYVIASDTR